LRTFRWILIGLVALALFVFAVDNRQVVTVSLWPLPIEASMSLYLVVLLTLLLGFLLGELIAWMNGHRWRREARLKAKRIEELERALAAQSPPKEAARELTRP
jgi:lipopolysaccharide assembly protein A